LFVHFTYVVIFLSPYHYKVYQDVGYNTAATLVFTTPSSTQLFQTQNWFEHAGYFAEAMDHARASGKAGAAEGLLERCRHQMMAREQWQLLEEIARNMPDRPGTLSLTLLVCY